MHFSRANSLKLTIDVYSLIPKKMGPMFMIPDHTRYTFFFGMTTHGSFTSFRALASKKDSTVRNSLAKLMPLELLDLSPIWFPNCKRQHPRRLDPFLYLEKNGWRGWLTTKNAPVFCLQNKNWTGTVTPFHFVGMGFFSFHPFQPFQKKTVPALRRVVQEIVWTLHKLLHKIA